MGILSTSVSTRLTRLLNRSKMCTEASKYGADLSKAFVMGGSAGANLSAAIALKLCDDAKLKPKGLIMACPFTCHPSVLPEEYKSWWHPERYLDAAMLNRAAMEPCMGEIKHSLLLYCRLAEVLTVSRRLWRLSIGALLVSPSSSQVGSSSSDIPRCLWKGSDI